MRPARALIDLQALRHNYRLAREATGARALAVIKADAYGHGAVRCAEALAAEADGFAVACIEEGLELREAGIRQPILLLEGFFEASELELIVAHDFWCVVHCAWQLEAIERASLARPLNVWLKMDSGMHRVGFFPEDFRAAHERLRASGKVAKIVMMSHFSAPTNWIARAPRNSSPPSRPLARAWKARSACAIRQPCSAGRRCPAIGYVRASCSTEPRRSSAHIRWPTACAR